MLVGHRSNEFNTVGSEDVVKNGDSNAVGPSQE